MTAQKILARIKRMDAEDFEGFRPPANREAFDAALGRLSPAPINAEIDELIDPWRIERILEDACAETRGGAWNLDAWHAHRALAGLWTSAAPTATDDERAVLAQPWLDWCARRRLPIEPDEALATRSIGDAATVAR